MKVTSNDIDVTKEDQVKINQFSRFNMQYHDKLKLIQEKKDLLTALKDGLDEMELSDDSDKISYQFGDCFFQIPVADARTRTEQSIKVLEEENVVLSKQIDETKKLMNKLKAKLYAKFGSTINLEED